MSISALTSNNICLSSLLVCLLPPLASAAPLSVLWVTSAPLPPSRRSRSSPQLDSTAHRQCHRLQNEDTFKAITASLWWISLLGTYVLYVSNLDWIPPCKFRVFVAIQIQYVGCCDVNTYRDTSWVCLPKLLDWQILPSSIPRILLDVLLGQRCSSCTNRNKVFKISRQQWVEIEKSKVGGKWREKQEESDARILLSTDKGKRFHLKQLQHYSWKTRACFWKDIPANNSTAAHKKKILIILNMLLFNV